MRKCSDAKRGSERDRDVGDSETEIKRVLHPTKILTDTTRHHWGAPANEWFVDPNAGQRVTTLRHNARPSANTNLHGRATTRLRFVLSIRRSIIRTFRLPVPPPRRGATRGDNGGHVHVRCPPTEISALSFSRVTTARMYGCTYDYRPPRSFVPSS